MKAFLLSLVALVAISAVAAAGLSRVTLSSQQDFSVPANVRL